MLILTTKLSLPRGESEYTKELPVENSVGPLEKTATVLVVLVESPLYNALPKGRLGTAIGYLNN
ncbi:MAG TPA: hypothetical protein PKN79_05075, partial [Sphaerochaeta sp.]|nr:hypothetical protein [Sphaerochaeta sp.]